MYENKVSPHRRRKHFENHSLFLNAPECTKMIKNQLISVVKILNFWRKLFEIMPRSLWLTSWFLSLGWSLISANSRQKKMSFKPFYFSARNAPKCRKMHLNSQIFGEACPLDPTSLLTRFTQLIPRFARSLWATKDDLGHWKKYLCGPN